MDSSSSLSLPLEPPSARRKPDYDNLPIFSLRDVSQHFSPDDAWMVIYDKVYNLTKYLNEVKDLTFILSISLDNQNHSSKFL